MTEWKKEQIRQKLLENQSWLERGILAIYERQTFDEQRIEDSIVDNGMGFNKPDSHYMSYVARWLKSGKHLTGHHADKARKVMTKYAGQLADIANGKL